MHALALLFNLILFGCIVVLFSYFRSVYFVLASILSCPILFGWNIWKGFQIPSVCPAFRVYNVLAVVDTSASGRF